MRFNRIWFIGLAAIVAIAAIAGGQSLQWSEQSLSHAIVQAQTPTPEETPALEATPTIEETPIPEASPTPEETPAPEATPTPAEISPSPTPATPEIEPPSPATLPLAEMPYQDASGRFQVGILQGFNQSVVTGVPLFESSDGQLAYTVAVRPRAADAPLREWALTQVAIDTFNRGEGMVAGDYETVDSELGGAFVPWTGTLTLGNSPQPMQGILLSRQIPDRLLILAIAATENAADRIDAVYSTLEPTLQAIRE